MTHSHNQEVQSFSLQSPSEGRFRLTLGYV